MKFKAAYYFDELPTLFSDEKEKSAVFALIKQLTHFNCKTDKELENDNINLSFAMLENLLFKRTSPRPSKFINTYFTNNLAFLKQTSEQKLHILSEDIKDLIYKSLHIISPETTKEKQLQILNSDPEFTKSSIKEDLIYSILPSFLGSEFLQLVEKDRDFMSLIHNFENKKLVEFTEGKYPDYANYQLDLCLENPINNQGIVININAKNIDNESITEREKRLYSEKIIELNNWEKDAIITQTHQKNIKEEINKIITFLNKNKDYYKIISENFDSPLYNSELGAEVLIYTLSPFAVARIQFVILKYLQSNILKTTDNQWNIAIIERDIPGAELAILDLENVLAPFLKEQNLKLPKINLTVFASETAKKIKHTNSGNRSELSNLKISETIDLLIDISILQRENINSEKFENFAKNTATIRSIYSIETGICTQNNLQIKTEFPQNKINKFIEFYNVNYEISSDINPYLYDILNNNILIINSDSDLKEKINKSLFKFCTGLVIYFSDNLDNNNYKTSEYEINFNKNELNDLQKKLLLKDLESKKYSSCKIAYKEALSNSFQDALYNFVSSGGIISALIFDEANRITEWDSNFSAINWLVANNILNFVQENSLSTKNIIFSNSISYDSEIFIKQFFNCTQTIMLESVNFNEIELEHDNLKNLLNSRNKEKEIKQIENLLFNTNSSILKNKDIILSILKRKFNTRIDFEYYPEIFPNILKIFQNNKEIGNLNYTDTNIIKEYLVEETNESKEIVAYTNEIIAKKKTRFTDVFEWLETCKNTDYDSGIENSAKEIKILSFSNQVYEDFAFLLKSKLNLQFDAKNFITESIYLTPEKFKQKLQNAIQTENAAFVLEALTKFEDIRNFEATIFALYRIAYLGLIGNISINYKNKTIIIKFKTFEESELLNQLISKIKSLNAGNFISVKYDEIQKIAGKTFLHKLLIFYINYIYFELIPLQKQNLLSLNNAQRLKNRIENIKAYADFKTDYFRKKYANPNNVPNLLFDTENFTNSDIKIIYKYINECKYNMDNLLHLKSSTSSLKDQTKSNLVINILYLYSDLITNSSNIDSVHQLFDELMVVYDEFGIIFSELINISDKFLDKLYSRSPKVKEIIEPMKVIKLINGWLQNFNSKFLLNYESDTAFSEEIEFN